MPPTSSEQTLLGGFLVTFSCYFFMLFLTLILMLFGGPKTSILGPKTSILEVLKCVLTLDSKKIQKMDKKYKKIHKNWGLRYLKIDDPLERKCIFWEMHFILFSYCLSLFFLPEPLFLVPFLVFFRSFLGIFAGSILDLNLDINFNEFWVTFGGPWGSLRWSLGTSEGLKMVSKICLLSKKAA